MKNFKYTVEQINFLVGDFKGNFAKIKSRYEAAVSNGTSLVIFSELAITGYPIQDLAFDQCFVEEAGRCLDDVIALTKNSETAILIGGLHQKDGILYNAAFFILGGGVFSRVIKNNLPNYGVFDEKRVFVELKNESRVIDYKGVAIGVLICEDGWEYNKIDGLGGKKLDLIISLNASPFTLSKHHERIKVCTDVSSKYNIPSIYVNQVGGQDSLVFDGSSFVCSKNGNVLLQAKSFCEDSVDINIIQKAERIEVQKSKNMPQEISQEEKIYSALVLGLRDYVHKNGQNKVLLGVSGGIDSALVAAIAVDAFGAKNVFGVMLRSQYTSSESIDDAQSLSERLGIDYKNLSIEESVTSIVTGLDTKIKYDITEQNIQSRIRGVMLMALSNDMHMLLLSTSNKSESAVGYSTLYGDSCGAYAPIKDVYKTQVFKLSRWRNISYPAISLYKEKNVIPENIISKAPSAELRHDQKDEDELPEYEVLDRILELTIENRMSKKEILQEGFDQVIVEKVMDLLLKSEFKRQQSVLGPKISEMLLNIDRRYPITNKFFKHNSTLI